MKIRHAGLGLIAAFTAFMMLAGPASASTYTYNLAMTTGKITVGTVAFYTPGSSIPTCPTGTTTIAGTIDTTTTPGTITGTLGITAPFQNGFVGNNYLNATGTGTGTATGLSFTSTYTISFTIYNYNVTTCTFTTPKCAGTATLTVAGTAPNLPLNTSDIVLVNSTSGSIVTMTTTCPGFLGLVVRAGAALGISANDTLTPVPAGAEFHQL